MRKITVIKPSGVELQVNEEAVSEAIKRGYTIKQPLKQLKSMPVSKTGSQIKPVSERKDPTNKVLDLKRSTLEIIPLIKQLPKSTDFKELLKDEQNYKNRKTILKAINERII